MQNEGQDLPTPEETEGWQKTGEFRFPHDDETLSGVSWRLGQLYIHYSTFGSNGRSLSSRRFMPTSDDGALFDRRGAARRFSTFTAAKEAILAVYGLPDNANRGNLESRSKSALQVLDRTIIPVLGSKP